MRVEGGLGFTEFWIFGFREVQNLRRLISGLALRIYREVSRVQGLEFREI